MTNQEIAAEIARLYTAYANGETIECFTAGYGFCVHKDLPQISELNFKSFRVKPAPVMKWYRVALLCDGIRYTSTADDEQQESNIQKDIFFIRWLTDRIFYEVTP